MGSCADPTWPVRPEIHGGHCDQSDQPGSECSDRAARKWFLDNQVSRDLPTEGSRPGVVQPLELINGEAQQRSVRETESARARTTHAKRRQSSAGDLPITPLVEIDQLCTEYLLWKNSTSTPALNLLEERGK